jgi:uncharacterized protein YycO
MRFAAFTDIASELRLTTFVTFRDWDIFYKWPWAKVSWTAHNKIGYLTATEVVIYPVRRNIRTVKLERIKRHTKLILPPDYPSSANIEIFYTQNVPNLSLFYHGVNSLKGEEKYAHYFDNPIKLPILDPIDHDEWNRRWEKFVSLLLPGDSIQLTDTSSLISRLITKYDQGSWSHSATYIGNGYVSEAIPIAGVVVRPLDVYKSPKYRLGLYRIDHTPESRAKFIGFMLSHVGDRYSYRKVVWLAVRKLLGLKLIPTLVSPNDLVLLMYNVPLIHVV